jgi:hypothetical protein
MPDGYLQEQALVCAFARTPMWARTRAAAMRLAEYCDPLPRATVACFWADTGYVRI